MLETAIVAARDRARLVEIARILIRYGVDEVVDLLGLRHGLARSDKEMADEAAGLTPPQRLRRAIEALGPTYVKLGQVLATRHDLLSPEWTEELERLHAHVTAVPWAQVEAQLEEDLGAPPGELFAAFDTVPLAAASMAQVYRARLHTGQEVVVKVRRPGLRPVIEADLRLMRHAAQLLDQQGGEWHRYRPLEVVEALSTALRDEMDFSREGRYGEEVARNFAGDPDVVIPAVYWDWTSERVLVQDFLRSEAPLQPEAMRQAGLDGPLLARRGASAFLRMVFDHRLFHADPHPGNLLALAGNRVGFIDFGMMGRLSDSRQRQLLILFRALVQGDASGVSGMLLDWADGHDADPSRLDAAAQRFLARHATAPLDISRALADFMGLARELKIALPADLTLRFKAFITAEGVLRRLDPGFDVVAVAGPLVRRAMRRRYGLAAARRRGPALAEEFYDLALDLPGFLRLLMYRVRRGRLGADIEIRQLGPLGQALERAATRLAIAIVTAAFALGLAPHLMDVGPTVLGVPLFALLGVVATVSGGALLLWWLWRRR